MNKDSMGMSDPNISGKFKDSLYFLEEECLAFRFKGSGGVEKG